MMFAALGALDEFVESRPVVAPAPQAPPAPIDIPDDGHEDAGPPPKFLYNINVTYADVEGEMQKTVPWSSPVMELGLSLASQLNPATSYAIWTVHSNGVPAVQVPAVNEHIFIVGGESHWSLAVVDEAAATITHYDSLPGLHTKEAVFHEGEKFGLKMEDKVYNLFEGTPKQTGKNNCGPACIAVALKLAVGLPVTAEVIDFQERLKENHPDHPLTAEADVRGRATSVTCPWSQWRRYIVSFLTKQPTTSVASKNYTPKSPWTTSS